MVGIDRLNVPRRRHFQALVRRFVGVGPGGGGGGTRPPPTLSGAQLLKGALGSSLCAPTARPRRATRTTGRRVVRRNRGTSGEGAVVRDGRVGRGIEAVRLLCDVLLLINAICGAGGGGALASPQSRASLDEAQTELPPCASCPPPPPLRCVKRYAWFRCNLGGWGLDESGTCPSAHDHCRRGRGGRHKRAGDGGHNVTHRALCTLSTVVEGTLQSVGGGL